MGNFNTLLLDIGVEAQRRLKETMSEKGLNASMETSDSIEYVIDSKGISIIANQNILALVKGRGPTVNNGKGDLLEKIKTWVKFKGIDEKHIWAIKNKIHKEGIEVPNQYNDGKLLEDTFNDDLFDWVDKRVGEYIKNSIK
jgi:hypothetical protein